MSSAEFVEWQAFQKIEGPLTGREDWRAAMVASVIANGYRDRKKRPRPYEPKDFMVDWEKESGYKPLPPLSTVEAKIRSYFAGVR